MSNYPLLDLFWTMFEFFIWILWFFLLFKIISDLFRSHDLSGWAKAGWMILVILLPFLGVLVYVIVRGHSMAQRDAEQAQKADEAFKKYVRDAAAPDGPAGSSATGAGPSRVDELARLAELKNSGALTEEEFQKAKDKLLA
jgi:uncharacterized membrane protein YcjF (UPF0283 family)